MTKQTRIKFFVFLLIAKVSFSAFAQTVPTFEALHGAAREFSTAMALSLPLNASLGLNWSDAYIGQFFPSLVPSFGIGGSYGVTSMDRGIMESLATPLGLGGRLPNVARFPFPGYTAEARIGGFFLPFDVGVKFGHLGPVRNPFGGRDALRVNYTMIGADIRYAVLYRPLLPTISVGFGFNYLTGGIGGGVGASQAFSFVSGGETRTVSIAAPQVDLNWRTFSFDFKAQISQSFLLVTPFMGIGASYARSRAGFEMSGDVTGDFGYLAAGELHDINVTGGGLSSQVYTNAFSARLFGGIGFTMGVFRLDFTGIYSFRDGNYGASVGLRFQL